MADQRTFNGPYTGEYLNRVVFPLGGIGAGMIGLEGTGGFTQISLRHQPNVFLEPNMFAALCVKDPSGDPAKNVARVLEGPVSDWKKFGLPGAANGGHGGKWLGLPRMAAAEFTAGFPLASVKLTDPAIPLTIGLNGWSPFIPGDADASSLPVAALEYSIANPSDHPVEFVFSFHAQNFMATGSGGHGVRMLELPPADPAVCGACQPPERGFVLWQPPHPERPWEQGAFSATVSWQTSRVYCAWFRGGWFDTQTILWHTIQSGAAPEAAPPAEGEPSPGASIYFPFTIEPRQTICIRVRLAWHVPASNLRVGAEMPGENGTEQDAGCSCGGCGCGTDATGRKPTHQPWYASRFADIDSVHAFWRDHYEDLRRQTIHFADHLLNDGSLPPEVLEAVSANMAIIKSPTVLRQADGRLWCWEGCCDGNGCCEGSCTHVWNYAQALAHLFPELERSLRRTEFGENQDGRGHQNFRAALPIREAPHTFHAAADGQLGGIMKVYREWRISGNTDWLRGLWPRVRQSLDYCIQTWDPDHQGTVREPHHNTYDIEFWGADGMCTSFYLGALKAATLIGQALGEEQPLYAELYRKGRAFMESELFNGEYFTQQIEWRNLRAGDPTKAQSFGSGYSPEARALLEREGPKYQYGTGCLSDGVLGAWMARVCGLGEIIDPAKERSHLRAVFQYNFRRDLSAHANPQRPTFALGAEGGLLLCTWPRGGALSLPFPYSDEVWTGIEYQVASHLMMLGCMEEGLTIVRVARHRYDGRTRNPFDEYECGHWYARAMSSYGLLQGLSGARYDAVERVLYLQPAIPGDFTTFLATATGYGLAGVKDGQPFMEVKCGTIPVERIAYTARPMN